MKSAITDLQDNKHKLLCQKSSVSFCDICTLKLAFMRLDRPLHLQCGYAFYRDLQVYEHASVFVQLPANHCVINFISTIART